MFSPAEGKVDLENPSNTSHCHRRDNVVCNSCEGTNGINSGDATFSTF